MKKVLYILLAIIFTPIVIFLLLVGLLYLPPVQQWAADKAASYASEATGMQVSVESVRLSWPLDFDLRGFRALQKSDSLAERVDTVADVRSLVASVELWPLLDGQVNVDRLDLNEAKINTVDLIAAARVKGSIGRLSVRSRGVNLLKSSVLVNDGSLENAILDVALSDSVPEDTTESETFWQVDISRFSIRQSQVALHTAADSMAVKARFGETVAKDVHLDLHDGIYRVASLDWNGGFLQYDQTYVKSTAGFDARHILLSQLNIGIDSLVYAAPNLGVRIRACNFAEKSGLKLDAFTGRFAMDSTSIALSDMHLKMPNTDLQGNLAMDMTAFDDRNPGQLQVQIGGHTSLSDFKPFLSAIPKEYSKIIPYNRIDVKGSLQGNLQRATLKGVDVNVDQLLTLNANGYVGNVLDANALFASVKVKGELKNLSFVKPILPKEVLRMVRIPRNIGYNYQVNVRNGRYTLDGAIAQGGGTLQTRGYYDTRSDAYQLTATAHRLALDKYLPGMGLHPFTGSVSTSGRGTDILSGRSSLALDANIKSFQYAGYTLDNIKGQITLSGQNLSAKISANNAMFAGNFTASGKASAKYVDLYLKGHLSRADLHKLAGLDQRWQLSSGVDMHVTSDLKTHHTADGSLDGLRLNAGKTQLVAGTFSLDGAMKGNAVNAHLDGTLDDADLQALGAMDVPSHISTTANLDVKTDLGDYYDVKGYVGNFMLTQNDQCLEMGDVNIDILSQKDTTHAMVSGGDFLLDADAHGSYKTVLNAFGKIGTKVSQQLKEKTIDHVALRELLPTAQLVLKSGTDNFFTNYLAQQGYSFREINAHLTSSQETGLNGTAMVDSLVYNDSITIDHADLALVTEGEELTYKLAVENNKTNAYPYKAYLNGLVLANGLQTQATILDKDDKRGLDLGLEAVMKGEGINVSITSPRSIIGYKEFAVNDNNYVYIGQDRRVSARMRLKADDGAGVQLYSNDEDSTSLQNVTLSMNNFELEKVFSVFPFMPQMSGVLNGDYHVIQTDNELAVSSDMTIDNMVYEQCPMGNIGTNLVYIPKGDGTHYVDAIISKDDYEVGQLTGSYDPAGQGVLDADFKLDRFPLHFVNGFIPDKIMGLRGTGDGELTVKGPLDKLDINGEVFVDSSYLYSEPYGIEMRFDNDPVTITNSRLLFENFNMYANNDQPLSMYGYLDFKNMDNMYLDVRMQAQNFELIDAKEGPRSEAYGKAFVNFFGAMVGPVSQLKMGGRLEVLGTTDMTYVMKESAISTDDQLDELVQFTDFTDTTSTKIVRPTPQGFQMDMSLSIDEQAHIVCALNEQHTNFIDLIGGGDLTMHYDNVNSITLNGRYTLNSGQMKYSLDMIPLRTFNIQEGSYIEFTGDPMNPTLSITATENIKANYSGGVNDRIVNFMAGVNMTRSLANPTVEFIVEAPDDIDAQNNLNTMSTEEKGKIAVTLLASGMYLADGSGNNFAMNSALASFMQSKINDISGRALSSMGLDLTANMESTADATGALHTDYTFNFSKRLWNNRLTINMGGRVSTGSEATEDNGAYFDSFSMQYRMNKNETQYLKLYYEREAYDWIEGQISEFGVGFQWKRKLQHFKDIFRWKNHDEDDMRPKAAPRDSTQKKNDHE